MDALRKLEVWRRACRLSVNVYRALGASKNPGFNDQLGRSALSIASNIAEGYSRESRRERIQFFRVAKASCFEAWTQIMVGAEAGFIERFHARTLAAETEQIAKMLYGLIRALPEEPKKTRP